MSDYVEQSAQNTQNVPQPQPEERKWPAEIAAVIAYLKEWVRREVSLSHSGLNAEDRADSNP